MTKTFLNSNEYIKPKKNDLSNKEKIEEIEEIVEKAVNEVLKKETDIIKSINSKTNH